MVVWIHFATFRLMLCLKNEKFGGHMWYLILPPYLKRMSFWTATRSPKLNFDFLTPLHPGEEIMEKKLPHTDLILPWSWNQVERKSFWILEFGERGAREGEGEGGGERERGRVSWWGWEWGLNDVGPHDSTSAGSTGLTGYSDRSDRSNLSQSKIDRKFSK